MQDHEPDRKMADPASALIPSSDLADRWQTSLRTLQRMRARREGPPWLRIGRSVFYRAVDITEFERSARQGEGL